MVYIGKVPAESLWNHLYIVVGGTENFKIVQFSYIGWYSFKI